MTNRQLAFLHLDCAGAIRRQNKVYPIDRLFIRMHLRDARALRLGATA